MGLLKQVANQKQQTGPSGCFFFFLPNESSKKGIIMLMFRSRQTREKKKAMNSWLGVWRHHYQQVSSYLQTWLRNESCYRFPPLPPNSLHPPLASRSLRHIYIFKQTVRAGKHTICYPPEFAWLKILFCISSAYKSLSALVGADWLFRRSNCSVLHTAIRWQGEHKGNQFGHCFELFYSGRLHSRRPFDAPAET